MSVSKSGIAAGNTAAAENPDATTEDVLVARDVEDEE